MLENTRISPGAVDRETVERLELLGPSVSISDRNLIKGYVESGQVFSAVTCEAARGRILQTVISLPGLIPSLRSFFENLKYLEPCCNILKKLLNPKEKKSIYQALSGAYFPPDKHRVEYSEGKLRMTRTGNDDDNGLWISYVQLWAFCMRHFPSMTQLVPRKEPREDKPSIQSNSALWHYLGDLAVELGFRTEQAIEFKQQDPYRTLAEQSLRSLHPDKTPDATLVAQMAKTLRRADPGAGRANIPQHTATYYLSPDRRCGRPFYRDYTQDKNSLFIPLIYGTETVEGLDTSTFFVKRDIFLSFFGNKYNKVNSLAYFSVSVSSLFSLRNSMTIQTGKATPSTITAMLK